MSVPGTATGMSTDLYQLTMAQAYWAQGMTECRAAFHLLFRRAPFAGWAAIACGTETVVELLDRWRFEAEDLEFLSGLVGADGQPLFRKAFLDWLGGVRFRGDVWAVKEGTWVLPGTPLLRVEASIVEAQIIETMLLTVVNFQTLIATKAARVVQACGGGEVLEFGLRRAQGLDGGLSASRAAYIGGCDATSNVAAAQRFGIPLRGTHAHSWVMAFEDEVEAFRKYADAVPNNVVLLVDTYDSLRGVDRAIQVGLEMKRRGGSLLGVRLDSGDLERLSRETRRRLDLAGLTATRIVASGDLDELQIEHLRARGAPIDVWGVGTRLVTSYDQPALGGVYKLGAIQHPAQAWSPRKKVSDDVLKATDPGRLGVLRLEGEGCWWGDLIYDLDDPLPNEQDWKLCGDDALFSAGSASCRELLVQRIDRGQALGDGEAITVARQRTREGLARYDLRLNAEAGVPQVLRTQAVLQRRNQRE